MRTRRGAAALLGVVLVAGLPACSDDQGEQTRAAARAFLDAWSSEDVAAASEAVDAPDGPRAWLPAVKKQLGGATMTYRLGQGSEGEDEGSQRYTVSWALPGRPERWSYDAELTLVRDGERWRVRWEPAVLHPELGPGQQLHSQRSLPERAAILDRAGQPLFGRIKVVTVGIEPGKVPDLNGLAATLASALVAHKVTAAEIVADARRAKPTAFVPVITLREPQYLQVKRKIYDLPGTLFRDSERLLPITPTFGQPLLGKVGEATAEVLEEAGAQYAAGDTLGTSGMQRAFNKRLAGTPRLVISLADSAGKPLKPLATFAGIPGDPVQTTLDRGVQTAAEKALAAVKQQAAIVAVKPSTGEVVAAANSAAAGFDIALQGKYPPGSTFKIVTAASLLQSRVVQPTSAVPCPGSLVVGGKTFINADRFQLGTVSLRRAFARSCNTTFTSLATKLPDGALTRTAAQFGVGVDWKLGVPSYDGAVPPPRDATENAADAIGQGTVLTSPLSMALVAATVQHGSVPTPTLISGERSAPPDPPAALDPALVTTLRDFSRAVVTEGTAAAVLGSAPGLVAGKTGTAEYGAARPPRSHSWFAGYRGDLAFAVFVFDGASSGTIATPVAESFLAGVPLS